MRRLIDRTRLMLPGCLVLAGCLVLLGACTDSSTNGGTAGTAVTSTPASLPPPSEPITTTPPAATSCSDAPQLPACREGHGEDS